MEMRLKRSASSSSSMTQPQKSNKNHSVLPLHEKVDLLNRIKELPPGTTNVKICQMFGIPKSTLSRIIKSEAKIRENFRYCKYFKRYTPCKDPDVDEMLKDWFYAARAKGLVINKSVLKDKAEELAQKLGRTEFCATHGWLSRWQVRHNVSFKRGHENLCMGVPSVKDWFAKVLPELMSEFSPDDIYHATEMGLFYRAAPDTTFQFSLEKSLSDSGKEMEQVTVLVCSNMTGRDKRKLLVIGENRNPPCFAFSVLDINRLPVTYRASESAMMTAGIFEDWLNEWDSRLRAENHRILVLVEMCPAHPPITTLNNIRLEFLPSCTGSVAHPLHQGVIKKLKTLYRIEILRLVQSHVEASALQPVDAAPVSVSSKITLLEAVQFLAKSWRAVRRSSISAGFEKAGFGVPSEKETDTMDMDTDELECHWMTLGLPKVENWDEFNSIDDAIQCTEENNPGGDLVETIVAVKRRQLLKESVQSEESGIPSSVDPSTEEDLARDEMAENSMQSLPTFGQDAPGEEETAEAAGKTQSLLEEELVQIVTDTEAKQSIALLQRFCTQRGVKDSVCALLDKFQDELTSFCFDYFEKKNQVKL